MNSACFPPSRGYVCTNEKTLSESVLFHSSSCRSVHRPPPGGMCSWHKANKARCHGPNTALHLTQNQKPCMEYQSQRLGQFLLALSYSLHWASAGLGPELSPSKAGASPPSAPYIGVNLKEWLGLGTGSTSGLQRPSASFPLTLRNTENSRSSECVVCAPTKGPLKAGPSLPLLHSPHRTATNVVN